MKLNKIVEKITKYLGKKELKKSQEEKLEKIIEELKEKKAKAKKELNNLEQNEVERRIYLQKRIEALSSLIKKSKYLI